MKANRHLENLDPDDPIYRIAGYTPEHAPHTKMYDAPDNVVPTTLPPYVRAYRGGTENTYALILPANIRPDGWPVSTVLGSDGGNGPAAIQAKAWEIYAKLLQDMHASQLSLERDLHPASLVDAAERVRELDRYKNASPRERDRYDELITCVLHWSELNGHPPMATITAPHAKAFLMTYGTTANEQHKLRNLLAQMYRSGIRHGYTDHNIMDGVRLPHARKHELTARLKTGREHNVQVFIPAPPH